MLKTRDESLEGKICVVSGAGNVAQYTLEKLLHMGAKPVTMSDSGGFVHDPDGIDFEKLGWVMELKNVRRGRISEYVERFPRALFTPVDPKADFNPLWNLPADCAFPSATQNEIGAKDAANLLNSGVYVVAEGANMPTVPDGVEQFIGAGILYGPGKAANAGGVAVSGRPAHRMGPRGGGRPAQGHHEGDPPAVPGDRRGLRDAGELRERGQHRRLPQGRRRDARPGHRLVPPHTDGPGSALAPARRRVRRRRSFAPTGHREYELRRTSPDW